MDKAEGITVAVHKIARIIFSLITGGTLYNDKIVGTMTERQANKHIKSLQKAAQRPGLQLVAAEAP